MTLAERFQINLRQIRIKKGRTQQQVAMAAGLSLSFISEMERHNREPALGTVERLAAALDVPPLRMLADPK